MDKIPGIKIVGQGDGCTDVRLKADATRESVERLFGQVASGERMTFYDPDYDSPSDPGAYVEVSCVEAGYRLAWSNYGWSTETIDVTRDESIAYLWAVRRANEVSYNNSIGSGTIHIQRRTAQPVTTGPERERLRGRLRRQLELHRPS